MEKTLVRKGIFVLCEDVTAVIIPMTYSSIRVREDMVRVGPGSADLRYRPEFVGWKFSAEIEYDELLKVDDIVVLINRAGFGVGIGEWRPEKGGDMGRFRCVEFTKDGELIRLMSSVG